jgi:hypothetical protein
VQYLNVSYYSNLANLAVSQFANINTANIVTVFHSNLNVASNANIFNMNVFTANIQSVFNAMYATMTANYFGNASGVWNLNISNVSSGTLPFSSTPGLGSAGITINGITGSAGQYITATGTGAGLQWGGPTATIIWAQVPGFVSPPIYYATANVGVGGPYSSMSWGVGSSSVNQYPGTPLDVYGGLGSFSNLMDATYTGTIRIQNQTPTFAYNGGLEFKTGTSSSGSGHRILTTTDSTGLSPLVFQFRSSTKTWSNAMAINCDAGNLSGYVGIGTMNPQYQLHVYQPSVSATLGGTLVQVSQATQQSTYSLQNSASGTCVFYLNGSNPSDGPANSATLRNNAGDLRIACASQTPLIYLQNSNGSVGINTNNPGTYNLNLYGTTSGTSTTTGALTNSGGSLSLMAGVNAAYIGVAGTYKYYFNATEFAPQNGTGTVNIGTAANQFGNIYASNHVGTTLYGALAGSNTISATTGTFSSSLSGKTATFSNGDTSTVILGPNTTWSAYLYLGASNPGNTVSGQARLVSTNGNCHLDAGTGQTMYLQYYNNAAGGTGGIISYEGWTHNGSLTVTGNISAGSDARLKKNIEPITDALEKVKKVSGYTFERTDIKIERQVGVIAQELIEVLPEAVIEDKEGMYSVAYGNITALLIQALKEEVAKREQLELRLSRFEEFFELAHMGL